LRAELLKDDWTRVRPEVDVKKIAIPQGEEIYIRAARRSQGKRESHSQLFLYEHGKSSGRFAENDRRGAIEGSHQMKRRHPSVTDLCDVVLRDWSGR
jgi:hypothetical protein